MSDEPFDAEFCRWSTGVKIALNDAKLERLNQYAKWGLQCRNFPNWLAILMEEVGELAKEIVEENVAGRPRTANLKKEACDVAAVALAIIQQIDTGEA